MARGGATPEDRAEAYALGELRRIDAVILGIAAQEEALVESIPHEHTGVEGCLACDAETRANETAGSQAREVFRAAIASAFVIGYNAGLAERGRVS